MLGIDDVRGRREQDKFTIAEVCADLGISRRTFYEWRANGAAASVHHAFFPEQRAIILPEDFWA
jgi:predicted DNA-binding transcriptional regulator AlpA